jgi:hypothetical protein
MCIYFRAYQVNFPFPVLEEYSLILYRVKPSFDIAYSFLHIIQYLFDMVILVTGVSFNNTNQKVQN